MSTTPQILKLVREGRVSPYDAALLLELRGRVAAQRDQVKFREQPIMFIAMLAVLLFVSALGLRRQD
jgi:hypothetical protein